MTTRKLFNAAIALLFAAPLYACGASTTDNPPDGATAMGLSIGNGLYDHEPVVDGDQVSVVEGSQGGVHVWLSVECAKCVGDVTLTYGVRSSDDSWHGEPQRTVVSFDQDVTGLTALLHGVSGQAYVGSDVELYAEITADGETFETTAIVHVASVEFYDFF